MKAKIIGFIWLGIMIFGYIFGLTFPNGYTLGDFVLSGAGMKAWSHGTSGMHYTAIYSGMLIVLGWAGAAKVFAKINPKLAERIPTILVIILLATPLLLAIFVR